MANDTDLDLCDLPIEVPRHQRLAASFHAVHFGLDATSAVISAPASPQGPAQISLCLDRIVTRNCSVNRRLPGLGILARRNHRMGNSRRNRLMALVSVICPVCGDTADVLIGWDLVQKFW